MIDTDKLKASDLIQEAEQEHLEESRDAWRKRADALADEVCSLSRENEYLKQSNSHLQRRLVRLEKIGHLALKLAARAEGMP